MSSEDHPKKHHRGRRGSRRRSFSGSSHNNNKLKTEKNNDNGNDESPALQSVNDIIAEIRRLPTTGDEQEWITVPYSRRGRRHSEPFHRHHHRQQQQGQYDSLMSANTSFLHHPLEAIFPLERQQQHDETNTEQIKHVVDDHLNPTKRVRSQSCE